MKPRYYLSALVLALPVIFLSGCKTTEENYRAAYEKTMAARQEGEDLDDTIYGRERRQMKSATVDTPDGPLEVRSQLVRVTEGGGGIPENLKRFNVVAGQFKQLFNATSLRERLVAGGYPGAFVVETAEPYYYVVAASYADASEAAEALEELGKKSPVTMKEPCPFILDATTRKRTHRR